MDKKGALEVSFNWIFVLLAGGAILLFFVFATLKETDASSAVTDARLAKRIDTLLSAVEQNPSSVKNIGYYETTMNFDCSNGEQHEFFIDGASARFLLESQIIFSPRKIGGSSVVAWTLDFNAPYPSASMLLLSDENTKYIFDEDVYSTVFNNFPSQFSKLKMTKDEIKMYSDEGFRKYVIITDDISNIGLQTNMRRDDKTTVIEMPASSKEGSLTFYKPSSVASNYDFTEIGDVQFANTEMLYAAIVSGDSELYNCGLTKLLAKTKVSDEINLFRLTQLYDVYSQKPTSLCPVFYDLARTKINEKINVENIDDFSSDIGRVTFVDAVDTLDSTNQQILRSSCPSIY